MKRYFIVFFFGRNKKNQKVIGNDVIITENNKYMSLNNSTLTLKEDYLLNNIVITNIIEIKEAEYYQYCS